MRLQLQVSDLTRRLQNAQHTIETEKAVAKNAETESSLLKQQLKEMAHSLRLETTKNMIAERKKKHQEEAVRYENNKLRAAKLHEELRMAEIDHAITRQKKEPLKLVKLRQRVHGIELAQDSQKKLLQQFAESEELCASLFTAAQMGITEDCIQCIEKGAIVNQHDAVGFLPLHYAIANGHYEIVKILLENGSDCSSYLTGQSPIVLAATNGYVSIIQLLVDFGANLEDKGVGGCPGIIAALVATYYDCMEYMVGIGADINSSDLEENTALHVATKLPNCTKLIHLLLQLGSRTDKINKYGHTPLEMALYIGNKEAIDALGGIEQSTQLARSIVLRSNQLDDQLIEDDRLPAADENPAEALKEATSTRNFKQCANSADEGDGAHETTSDVLSASIIGDDGSIASSVTFKSQEKKLKTLPESLHLKLKQN